MIVFSKHKLSANIKYYRYYYRLEKIPILLSLSIQDISHAFDDIRRIVRGDLIQHSDDIGAGKAKLDLCAEDFFRSVELSIKITIKGPGVNLAAQPIHVLSHRIVLRRIGKEK